MALNIMCRRLPKALGQAKRLISYQSSFQGLRAAAVFNDGSGFGYNSKGELVIVKAATGISTDGYNYGSLFQKPLERTSPVIPTKLVIDRDLWIEKSANDPTNRGNEPWQRPLVPRCGAANFSTYAANRFNSANPWNRPVFRHGTCHSLNFSSLAGDGHGSNPSDLSMSLVIFDKDGTLIDVNSVWIPWMETHVEQLEKMTGLNLSAKLYSAVGYCPRAKAYQDNGLLAHATIANIKDRIKEVLVESGIDELEASKLVDECCADVDTGDKETLQPLGDLPKIFQTLKSKGIKTAICTMDSRHGTMTALHQLGLVPLIDMIVCGDDEISKPKPAPDNALNICKDLNVCPTKTVVIGDTTADTGMGKSAGLGLTIGVLSGAGSKGALEKDSDLVLNSVDELLNVMFKDGSKETM
ncbi:uncharacterized protein LOC116306383 [Actinia tenebrosa]|uniref:Uncharacterized protein LOC116306383 n=1 Tax=Actinia tenebrosa TaxID=6105 RepID=A0A6P8J3Y0_ACTTE|nr:uncharacterized protein LOC116306383 [Actinia tenebrosa]